MGKNRPIDLNNKLRYIYMLDLEWLQGKTFYGQKQIYYTGQTSNLSRRILEHLHRNYGFVSSLRGYRKRLVFVKYVFGNEFDAIREEKRIKLLTNGEKKLMIISEENMLVNYFPFKNVVLKKMGLPEEQYIIPLNRNI